MKNNKGSEEDGITAEDLKAGGQTVVKQVRKLTIEVREAEDMPKE